MNASRSAEQGKKESNSQDGGRELVCGMDMVTISYLSAEPMSYKSYVLS